MSDLLGGKYVLGDCIGSGGMGRVYLATQPELEREVAVKVMHRHLAGDPHAIRRFHAEVLAGARLHHPGAAAVIDAGETGDGEPFLVMELVRGRTLGHLIRDEAPLAPARAIALVRQLLDVLGEVHAIGMVHADIKSDNLLVEHARDGSERIKLIDFGLARTHHDSTPVTMPVEDAEEMGERMISGTPEYLAPEVIVGRPAGPPADLYGACTILYELLTGATPFGGGSATDVMHRHLHDPVVPPSLRNPGLGLSRALDRVIERALAKDPAKRFATADALSTALLAASHECGPATGQWIAAAAPLDPMAETLFGGPPSHPRPHKRLARGSDASAEAHGERRLRAVIGDAILRGVADDIGAGYLHLAALLDRVGRGADAASELQEGIDLLSAGPRARRHMRALRDALTRLRDPQHAKSPRRPVITERHRG